MSDTATSSDLLDAIDRVSAAFATRRRTSPSTISDLTRLRREISERSDHDIAIGTSFDQLMRAHDVDLAGTGTEFRGALIRAAVEATGATITPPESKAAPTEETPA